MHTHLVIPGLMWPSEQARGFADTLHLPALVTLLGRSSVKRLPGGSPEAAMDALFGTDSAHSADAAIRRLGEDDAMRTTEPVLCADPTHLHFSRDHLLLTDAMGLEITPDEAAALVASLNDTFSDVGRFEAPAPDRWYLAPKADTDVQFARLGEVTSRPIAYFMPEGEDAMAWHRIANEIQVFLHNHPVNLEREKRRQRAINNVWFWGGGCLTGSLCAPADVLAMSSLHGRGLVRAAGQEPMTVSTWDDLPAAARQLVEIDTLLAPSRYLDLAAWQEQLRRLEEAWFKPVLQAIKRRTISHLTLSLPDERGSRELSLTPNRQLQFWRKVESLEAFTILQYL